MNRMDEYTALLAELEQTPEALNDTVSKALNRQNTLQKKRRFLGTSLGGLAACFAAFVLLVNLRTDPPSGGSGQGGKLVSQPVRRRGE